MSLNHIKHERTYHTVLSLSALLGSKFLLHGCTYFALTSRHLSHLSFFAFFKSQCLWMVQIVCFHCSIFPHFQSAMGNVYVNSRIKASSGAFWLCSLCFSFDSKLTPPWCTVVRDSYVLIPWQPIEKLYRSTFSLNSWVSISLSSKWRHFRTYALL